MVYTAFVISSLLDDWRGVNIPRALDFVRKCMTYEGGFGQAPGNEAQGNLNHTSLSFFFFLSKKIFFAPLFFFSLPWPWKNFVWGECDVYREFEAMWLGNMTPPIGCLIADVCCDGHFQGMRSRPLNRLFHE